MIKTRCPEPGCSGKLLYVTLSYEYHYIAGMDEEGNVDIDSTQDSVPHESFEDEFLCEDCERVYKYDKDSKSFKCGS